ncbi:MAG: ubiquinone/menaquinone biosynthesis C-methylase UbiE [Candidatus Paceibacteria bacterium]|jgi:ubiquinone/menaquinone biosynthesis C-methylase UbiE
MVCRSLRQRLFANGYDHFMAKYESVMNERKQALLSRVRGKVVELGPGTGVNLKLLPKGVEWMGIEPNVHMHPILLAKAEALGISADLRCLSAGNLPLEDASVDSVFATLVFCSVDDVDAALAEIHRVLKPGGCFIFWEHVLAQAGFCLRASQHLITPLHLFCGDGCRCNRDFSRALRASPFQNIELEEFRVPPAAAPVWVRPHVAGVALRS